MTMNVNPPFCPLSHRCEAEASRASHDGTVGTLFLDTYTMRDRKASTLRPLTKVAYPATHSAVLPRPNRPK